MEIKHTNKKHDLNDKSKKQPKNKNTSPRQIKTPHNINNKSNAKLPKQSIKVVEKITKLT